MSNTILLPYDQWRSAFDDSSSISAFCDQAYASYKKGDNKRISVKAVILDGKRYTASGCLYGSLETSHFWAWELVPDNLYEGPKELKTMIYHDEQAIESGKRDRGDLTGLMVSHKKREYTIARGAIVKPILPSLESALSLQEAQEYFNQVESNYLRCQGHMDNNWIELHGHAIRTFRNGDEQGCWLYYRNRKDIDSVRVKDLEALKGKPDSQQNTAAVSGLRQSVKAEQMSLF